MRRSVALRTYGPANLFELASEADELVSGGESGSLHIFSVGSTGAVIGLPGDTEVGNAFVAWVTASIPHSLEHRHPGNAFAHLRSTILKTEMIVAVAGGRLLGPLPFLLENTAGRKTRPLVFTLLTEDNKGGPLFKRDEFTIETQGWIDLVDITGRVMDIVAHSGIDEGRVTVYSLDERSAVISIENEMRLVRDTADFIDRLTRRDGEVERRTAGHIGSALLGQSLTVPLEAGRPALGTWQQILLADLAEGGEKRIMVDVIGE